LQFFTGYDAIVGAAVAEIANRVTFPPRGSRGFSLSGAAVQVRPRPRADRRAEKTPAIATE
jgi:hypothetical protein